MTAAAAAAGQLAAACLLGMGLGVVYELLRPLRPRLTCLSDGIFTVVMLYTWLHLVFGICRGDIRMVQTLGLFAGAWLFRITLGRPLERLIRKITGPAAICVKKYGNSSKNYLHLGENRLQ